MKLKKVIAMSLSAAMLITSIPMEAVAAESNGFDFSELLQDLGISSNQKGSANSEGVQIQSTNMEYTYSILNGT